MFECAYTFGFRKSELLSMKVEQLDLAARTLSLEVGETKNDEARLIDLSEQPKLFELLRECAAGKGPVDLVFTRDLDASGRKSKVGGRIVDFRDSWAKATEAAGVPGLLFHDLRRTGVSNMIRDGLDEKVAMTISGHKTRSVFDRYHIVRPEALRDAAVKMARGHRERQRAAIFQSEFFKEPDVQRKPS
jgi:integrase